LNHVKNRDKQSIDFLFSWIDQGKIIKHELLWKIASWLFPLLNITLLILVILQFASFGFLLLSLFITAGLTYGFYKLNLRITRELGTINTVIGSYREMLLEIEGEAFDDGPLEKLKSNVINNEYKASSQLKELEQLTHLFESINTQYNQHQQIASLAISQGLMYLDELKSRGLLTSKEESQLVSYQQHYEQEHELPQVELDAFITLCKRYTFEAPKTR